MVEAIKQNFPQRKIADASFRYPQEVNSSGGSSSGVNDYMLSGDEEDSDPADRSRARAQAEGDRVAASKAKRDSGQVERALGELKAAAATDANLMPPSSTARAPESPRARWSPRSSRSSAPTPSCPSSSDRQATRCRSGEACGHQRLGARWYEYRYVRRGKPGRIAGLVALVVILGAGVAYAVTQSPLGVIGPSTGIQPSGRHLHPAGRLTQLGNLPTGGVLTPNGRYLWALSTGRGRNDVRIVQVAKIPCGKVHAKKKGAASEAKKIGSKRCNRRAGRNVGTLVQTIPFPGLTGGVAMSRDGHTAFVSGVADSTHQGEEVDPSVPGRQGDVIHVMHYDPKTGTATRAGIIPVPPPSDAPAVQDFPPGTAEHQSWPRDIAVSPNGRTLLVALNLADAAALIDTATGQVRYVNVGHYPYGAGITTDGRYGLVTQRGPGHGLGDRPGRGERGQDAPGRRAALPSREHRRRSEGAVGVRRKRQPGHDLGDRHQIDVGVQDPVGRAPSGHRNLADVRERDARRLRPALCRLGRGRRGGLRPLRRKKLRPGRQAEGQEESEEEGWADHIRCGACRQAHEQEEARRVRPFQLIGRIPTGSYPTMAASTPKRHQLVWVSARGLGVGPNPNGPNPNTGDDTYLDQYLPSIVDGDSGVLTYPSDQRIRKLTPVSDRQVDPEDSRCGAGGHPDSRERPDQARLLHRPREPDI